MENSWFDTTKHNDDLGVLQPSYYYKNDVGVLNNLSFYFPKDTNVSYSKC